MTAFEGMTPELQAYVDFNARTDDGGWEEQRRLRKLVDSDLLRAYDRVLIEAAFVTEDEGSRREHLSPSGRYKLVTSSFGTKPGCWSYCRGQVYSVGSDEPIATVNRNYSAFPFLFVENHPNGHRYLVCGEDYQGQTVVELDTGARRDHLPGEAHDGHGFCWASHTFHPETKTLVVDGCHWACPYEFRFYDFSDPMSGWPQLETEGCVDSDDKAPTFEPDGTIKCYQTESEDDDEGEKPPVRPLAATSTFRREGLKLAFVEGWVSDKEKARRAAQDEGDRKWDEWVAEYRATDPLYLRAQELMKEPPFEPKSHGIGQTYDGWCPDWKGQERRVCHRMLEQTRKGGKGYTLDLDIAHLTGPVKLQVFKDGKTAEAKFFEHSVAGVEAAFAYARGLL